MLECRIGEGLIKTLPKRERIKAKKLKLKKIQKKNIGDVNHESQSNDKSHCW
jgi:hypothetical protein